MMQLGNNGCLAVAEGTSEKILTSFMHGFIPSHRVCYITDLKKRLDRATYRFKIQVFEDIGTILVGPNLVLIGGI